ncbi:MAG: hypothetical protein O3A51_11455, partial [Verrucomicrobia bacterium]|nr:hypothetical protein [Verrucomicrobiota bacterium]
WLACYALRCADDTADPQRWIAIGRDRYEETTALTQLAVLLCREGRYQAARQTIEQAVERMPESALLWRWLVSLSGNDRSVIAAARSQCPDDPEIWLTDLAAVEADAPDTLAWWIAPWLRGKPAFPATVYARGGEYLVRRGHPREGSDLVRFAVTHAHGLYPIYLQGLTCALQQGDSDWAVQCTLRAIETSLKTPLPLYKRLVDLKSSPAHLDTDFDMVEALKNLRKEEPENPLWAQMLGFVRFQRGGWEILDAFNQMNEAIESGVTNMLVFTVAAEASRQMDNHERSVDIIRRGMRHYPDDITLKNNLVYTLIRTPDGLGEALERVPELLDLADDDPRILDTVCSVYIRAGDWDAAAAFPDRILAQVEPGSTLWFRATFHQGRLMAEQGDVAAAVKLVTKALNQSQGLPDDDIALANRQLSIWNSQLDDSRLSGLRVQSAPATSRVETLVIDDLEDFFNPAER